MSPLAPGRMVSVITVCRNAEELVEPTMISVLGQTYADLEYVIVDGASSDATVAVIRAVCDRYPARYTTVRSEPDAGMWDAMNKGIERATGDVIVHLHAGDRFVDDGTVARVMGSQVLEGWRWAVGRSIAVDGRGTPQHVYRPDPDYRTLVKKNMIPHQSTFIARDVFLTHGLFRADLQQAADYEMWVRLAFLAGERYVVLPFDTTYYLTGGRSSRIVELLSGASRVRRDLRKAGARIPRHTDALFLLRILAFWCWAWVKVRLASDQPLRVHR